MNQVAWDLSEERSEREGVENGLQHLLQTSIPFGTLFKPLRCASRLRPPNT